MKIKKILLVHSAHYDGKGNLVQSKTLFDRLTSVNVEKLGLLLLAALTPPHIKIEKVEDYFSDINFDSDAEVVAIHAQVMQLSRAIDIAKKFREKGKIILMGGFLPSMHPELITDYVDAYCIGEGDLVWPLMLQDIENDCLKKEYKSKEQIPLDKLPIPRYDLVDKSRMVVYPVQATRGCPFTCDYCSIVEFYQRSYRYRPVDQIIRDIKATKSKQIFFTDDNLMENKKYSKELFRAMKENKKVYWGTQCTINIAQDAEMLTLAKEAGCMFVAVGIESLSQKSLNNVSKGFNQVDQFTESIAKIHQSGIAVHALIVFGFPEDTLEIFDQTIDYLEENGVAIAEFFICTPYPKTPLGKRILEQGLIIDEDLNHYREPFVVFKHPTMSSQEIIDGYWRAMNRFYSVKSIIKRTWRGTYKNKIYHFVSNFYYMLKVKRGIIPVYYGAGDDTLTEAASTPDSAKMALTS